MNSIVVFAVLALAIANFSAAEDDGQYHPEKYGDNGQYREKRYFNEPTYFASPKYQSIAYQPSAFVPTQELVAPVVQHGDSYDQAALASSVSAVTYTPPTFPAFRANPIVYHSTPAPVVVPVKPSVYVTPKPFTYVAQQPTAFAHHSVVSQPLAVGQPAYAKNYAYTRDALANIVRSSSEFDNNNYQYSFESDNGIAVAEAGTSSAAGGGTRASGFYEYIGDDGQKYRVDWTADENGFRPRGAHIPV